MENTQNIKLNILFGKDQENLISVLVRRLKKEGHIKYSKKISSSILINYHFVFYTSYGLYLFGFEQAKLAMIKTLE